MMIIYATVVKEIGPNAKDFLEEEMMVTFGEDAPAELRPYCFLIDQNALTGEMEVGDQVYLGETSYEITAIGEQAIKNLKDLGHVTLNFKGETDPAMAGTLYLEKKEPVEVSVGTQIIIKKK
ncbi:PTS glucitol/sorbitol transporter subunit IIA [Proteiniclasticum sp. C24MP]|uniref:PTS glucitol/sorbitol transporter subunit IIA n=1 Tax=Proteiniclasticum sp. C24MP TaxID=3374101 RepID=UPI00375506CF